MGIDDARAIWQEYQERQRSALILEHRETLMEHLSVSDPIPNGSRAEVSQWLDRYASTVTKQLADGESDNTDGGESGGNDAS